MEVLDVGVFGLTVTFDPCNKSGASLVSSMREPYVAEHKFFNSAVDVLESLILAHFCAGVDILTPAYLQGIEDSYHAVCNNIVDDDKPIDCRYEKTSTGNSLK